VIDSSEHGGSNYCIRTAGFRVGRDPAFAAKQAVRRAACERPACVEQDLLGSANRRALARAA